jgi:hypothetical protein
MSFLQNKCSKRPGILKLKRDGALVVVASYDNKGKRPYVCRCECEAADIVLSIAAEAAVELLLGRDLSNFPEPDDFVYCYVDADIKDEPVTSLDEAASAIAAIKNL